jgi:hypothetical protein
MLKVKQRNFPTLIPVSPSSSAPHIYITLESESWQYNHYIWCHGNAITEFLLFNYGNKLNVSYSLVTNVIIISNK